jgi:hypothetical protein
MAPAIALQKDEEVLKEYKRHPFFLVQHLALVGGGVFVPILLVNWVVNILGGFLGQIAQPLAMLWMIGGLVIAFVNWYSYEHDQWMVTNQRLVDVNRHNIFHASIATADLVNILDLSVEQRGILPNMFGYGDVTCQTAGGRDSFVIRGVPNPNEALEIVDSIRDKARIDLKRA